MKKAIGKLAFRRETLRVLRTLGELAQVIGGADSAAGCPAPQRESGRDCPAPAEPQSGTACPA
jgi:hypothetical protein